MSTSKLRVKKFTQIPDLGAGVRNRLNQTGAVMAFAGPNNPVGWLPCDGTVYRQEAYPTLYAVIGTTFNTTGQQANEFRVPTLTNLSTNVRYFIKV